VGSWTGDGDPLLEQREDIAAAYGLSLAQVDAAVRYAAKHQLAA
jgi:uncharacterized protein (DUF433 family)